METQPHNPVGEGTPSGIPTLPQDDLTPLSVIRTETVFSKLPRHILSKSGKRPEIRLEKSSPEGKIEFRWHISYSDAYGPASQLAYDLDTLVVERAIEETFEEARRTGNPLPRLIPIGSLTEICRKLGMADAGTNLKKIKRALQQNALTGITAYLKYRGNDGSEQWIDATFTCYGVVFTGKRLPDGRKAEQTYISTTNEYHHVLSTAPTRPLDYNYKAQLAPTPRRLYEILSFPMYGALKNNQPFAKLLYSDYCARAPHIRYFTFDQVKKQMYTVNKPHKISGYIESVHYEKSTDEQGQLDWMMYYKPGPKAKAEYGTFTGKKIRNINAITVSQVPAGEHTQRRPRQRRLNLVLAPEPQPAIIIDYRVIAELGKRGVGETDARQLIASLQPNQPILVQLEWGDYQIAQARGKITNPPGFYISLLQRNVPVPSTFETSEARKARERAEFERQQAIQEEAAAVFQREEEERAAADAALDRLQSENPEQWQVIFDQAQTEVFSHLPEWMRAKPAQYSSIHEPAIRSRMRKLLEENPHYATKETPRQATPLPEVSTPSPLLNLEAFLSTPLLEAPPEPAPATPEEPRPTSTSVETHLL